MIIHRPRPLAVLIRPALKMGLAFALGVNCRLRHRRDFTLDHSKSLRSAVWKRLFALDDRCSLYRNNASSGRKAIGTRHSFGCLVAEHCEERSFVDRWNFYWQQVATGVLIFAVLAFSSTRSRATNR